MESKYKILHSQPMLSIGNRLSTLNSVITTIAIMLVIVQTSCKKIVDVEGPDTSINAANVYLNNATASAVLTGVYTNMSKSIFQNGGIPSLSFYLGLSADELTLYSGSTNVTYGAYYANALTNQNTLGSDFWNNLYQTIFVTNSAIEGLTVSNSLTPGVKQQLLGEAKFMRAFCYFYLVNLYGDAPLALTTDHKINATLSRAPKNAIYQQIIIDLKDAQNQLSSNYLKANLIGSTTERVRPTKWAATALLARVYLYTGDNLNAAAQATAVINNSSTYNLTNLNIAFLKNNSEAIWQLQPVLSGYNTQEARLFILPSSGPSNPLFPVYLNTDVVNSFEIGDQRKAIWTNNITVGVNNYFYSFKYKVSTGEVTEYTMVLRLAEQYLIRAEARTKQNDFSGAQADLNVIRSRAGLPNTTANDNVSLLNAILHERQVELFTEWGHRWLDLKRTGNVDAVMGMVTPTKGGTWQTTDQLYPIPETELLKAPQLTQNPGY